jgi:LCP family protein required for cell wall assembly
LDTNDTVTDDTVTRGSGRSPSLAALLSFLWPGLGQLYLRNRRAAATFAVPAFLLLLLLGYELRQGPVVFGARFIDPAFSRAAAVLVLGLGVWRLASVVHAFLGGEPSGSRKVLERGVVIALVAVIAISHLGAGFLLAETSNAEAHVFATPGPSSLIDFSTPVPTQTPTLAPSQTPEPAPTPAPTPSIDRRVTILLTGYDSNVTRPNELLYDSIMVVSYDPVTNSVQMVSVPRDSTAFPMYLGTHQPVASIIRINSLFKYAGAFGAKTGGYDFMLQEVQYLVGVHIDYYAAMDLNGFVKLIDLVGGIDVVNPAPIDDYLYDWLDRVHFGFHLAAGPQHLDGKTALAYVRSRRGAGDNDFTRSSRQQEVLVDLLHKMAEPGQILNLPSEIQTMGSTVSTNFPADKVADYVNAVVNQPSFPTFTQVVLSPSAGYSMYYGSAVCLYNAKVAALSVKLFGKDSLWYGKPAPANTCIF